MSETGDYWPCPNVSDRHSAIIGSRSTFLIHALLPSFAETHLTRAAEIDFHTSALFYIFCRLSTAVEYELSTNDSRKFFRSVVFVRPRNLPESSRLPSSVSGLALGNRISVELRIRDGNGTRCVFICNFRRFFVSRSPTPTCRRIDARANVARTRARAAYRRLVS